MILLKRLLFSEEFRPDITFSDATKIRLDPLTHRVMLKRGSFGYPTEDNIYVISPTVAPSAIVSWLAFQAKIIHKHRGSTIYTGDGFRLHDGTNQWYWDGEEWIHSTTSWNSEPEIAAHIQEWPGVSTKTLRVVINLRTVSSVHTPELLWIALAGELETQAMEDDLFFRTLTRRMKNQIRPTSDFVVAGNGTTSIDMAALLTKARKTHKISDVLAVYNETDDPTHGEDLLASYNANTKIVTLTGASASDKTYRVRIVYQPTVAFVGTSVDYVELEEVPAILVSDVDVTAASEVSVRDLVADKYHRRAYVWYSGDVRDYRFSISVIAPGSVDCVRLSNAVNQFFADNHELRMTETDEPVLVRMERRLNSFAAQARNGVYTISGSCVAPHVYVPTRKVLTAEDGLYPVGRLVLTSGSDEIVAYLGEGDYFGSGLPRGQQGDEDE